MVGYSHVLESGAGQAAVALGDVDGDGLIDIGSASFNNPNGGPMVWSGRDLSLLFRNRSAVSQSIVAIGDVTGDGRPEIGYGGYPFRVVDGATFQELYSVSPPFGAVVGWRSLALGDVDGDGAPDFALSAPNNVFLTRVCFQAWIYAYSGKDGSLLWSVSGEHDCDHLGIGLAVPGDLNGDGVNDLAATRWGVWIRFMDGRTGATLEEAEDELVQRFFGYALEAVGDINGNGFGDVLAYGHNYKDLPPPFNQPTIGMAEARLIDGGTREFLYRVTYPRPLTPNRHFGWARAFTACGDWNRDGQPDLAIAAPSRSGNPGAIDIFSGFPVGVRALPEGCDRSSSALRIGASGIPVLGSSYPLHLTDLAPGTRAWLVLGTSLLGAERGRLGTLPRGAEPFGAGDCSLRVQPELVLPTAAVQAGGQVGAATVRWKMPGDPSLAGTKVYAQWLVPGLRPIATSRLLEITIQAGLPPAFIPP